jgi:hypothetical protein
MSSTAFAMPSATTSMRRKPTASGLMIGNSGIGVGVGASVIAEMVDAVAGAAVEMLDPSPMATAAINVRTLRQMDRVARCTKESCLKNHPRHSETATAGDFRRNGRRARRKRLV